MCVYTHVSFIRLSYIHRRIYIYISLSLSLPIYVYIHTNIHAHMYMCIHVCMYACMYVRMYVHIHIYTYIYVHTYKHTHTHTHTQLRTFQRGEELTHYERELVYISSGVAEAVITEDVAEISHHFHPIGFPVPDAGQKSVQRSPVHTVMGPGNILGAPDFFFSKHSLTFRARSAVTARVLRSGQSPQRLLELLQV